MMEAKALRHAWRRLRRSPGFAGVAMLTMAAGVAANVAVFGVLRAVVLDPLPFRDPVELRWVRIRSEADPGTRLELSHPAFRDLADRTSAFSALAAFPTAEGPRVWEAGGIVASVRAVRVSGGYFELLGTPALVGRTLEPSDDLAGAAPVAVVSWRIWQARLGGLPDAVGSAVRLDGRDYTVVGVMPRGFADPAGGAVWTALIPEVGDFAEDRAVGFLHVIGRLRPGTGDGAAADDLSSILVALAQEHGPAGARPVADLETLDDALFGSARSALLLLSAAAGLVLLLTCVNLAALLLARGVTRRTELAMRSALGASRRRLVTELTAEAVVLGAGAAVAGVWVAGLSMDALTTLLPADLYRVDAVRIDAAVVGFALVLSVVAAAVFGWAAAITTTRRLHGAALVGRATRGVEARRTGHVLMAVQIAIAVVVLVAGGLMGRSFMALRGVDTGFRTDEVLSFELFVPDAGDGAAVAAEHARLRERLLALPGVASAASVLLRPLEGPEGYDYPFTVEDVPAADQETNPLLNYEAVTADYFATVGIPVLDGRPFDEADGADSPPVVIVSDAVARRFFPDGEAVGRRMRWGGPSSTAPWMTVVGVAGRARYRGLADVSLDVYVPHAQSPWALRHVVLRIEGEAAPITAALPRIVEAVRPGAHPVRIATLGELASVAAARPRFHAVIFGIFAGAALLLAAVGTWGVVAHFTSRRLRELGVRLALGAQPRGIASFVLAGAARTALLGTAAGVVVALAAVRALSSLLWGVPPLDPLTFIAAPALVVLVTIAAAAPLALRAARTDPNLVLRME